MLYYINIIYFLLVINSLVKVISSVKYNLNIHTDILQKNIYRYNY